MADFCNQCVRNLNLGSEGDFVNPSMSTDDCASVICEGCGFIYVNSAGDCMGNSPLWGPATLDPRSGGCVENHPSLWPPMETPPEENAATPAP